MVKLDLQIASGTSELVFGACEDASDAKLGTVKIFLKKTSIEG